MCRSGPFREHVRVCLPYVTCGASYARVPPPPKWGWLISSSSSWGSHVSVLTSFYIFHRWKTLSSATPPALGSPLVGVRRADALAGCSTEPDPASSGSRGQSPVTSADADSAHCKSAKQGVRSLAGASHDLARAGNRQPGDDHPIKSAPRPTQHHLCAAHAAHPLHQFPHSGPRVA